MGQTNSLANEYCALYKDVYHNHSMWVFHVGDEVWFSLSSIRRYGLFNDTSVEDALIGSLPTSEHTSLPFEFGAEASLMDCISTKGLAKLIEATDNKEQSALLSKWLSEILNPSESGVGTY